MPRQKKQPPARDFMSEAMRKGFKVSQGPTGWLIHVPARKGHKANTQGDFKDQTRAWRAAASLAQEF